MSGLSFLSALELAHKIRKKEISSRELLDHYLARVERLNPRINAVVTLDAPLDRLPLLLKENAIVPLLDASIETLAEATDPDSDVVTPSKVADRLDALVAVASLD